MPKRDDNHRHGVPFETPVGPAITYFVEAYDHSSALTVAKATAKSQHHKVLDVNSCVEQPYGGWVVEFRIKEGT